MLLYTDDQSDSKQTATANVHFRMSIFEGLTQKKSRGHCDFEPECPDVHHFHLKVNILNRQLSVYLLDAVESGLLYFGHSETLQQFGNHRLQIMFMLLIII